MLVIPSGSPAASGYNLARSLRFRASASANLSRTFTSSATWTFSAWVKCGALNVISPLFGDGVKFLAGNTLTAGSLTTAAVYRDTAAFYHVCVSNAGLFINGVLVGSVTTSALTNPKIGSNGTNYFDGLMAEVNFIDGQALTPASFGEIDATTGVWKPKKYTGSYGTNGFYLPFTDNSALTTASNTGLGKDFSGNGNYWVTNNISITAGATYDSFTDVPTLTSATASNYATLNPLVVGHSTITNANLTASGTTDLPTIIPDSGTWYFEISGVSKTWTPPAAFPAAAGDYNFGQRPFANTPTATLLNTFNLPAPTIVQGNKYFDATLYTGNAGTQNIVNAGGFQPDFAWVKSRSVANNNIVVDSVRGATSYMVTNNNGIEGTNAAVVASLNSNGLTLGSDTTLNTNASTGVAWQWKKGATPGFDVVLYTGNGANRTISHGLGVAPGLVIVKRRSVASDWAVWHTSMSAASLLTLNLTYASNSDASVWNSTAPTSSAFSLGTNTAVNANTSTYVAYLWAEIPGFSRFGTYQGNGTSDGPFVYLGFSLRYLLVKRTDVSSSWAIHDTARDTSNVSLAELYANAPNAETINPTLNVDILSNGFKLRSLNFNASGGTYSYCAFAERPFKHALAR